MHVLRVFRAQPQIPVELIEHIIHLLWYSTELSTQEWIVAFCALTSQPPLVSNRHAICTKKRTHRISCVCGALSSLLEGLISGNLISLDHVPCRIKSRIPPPGGGEHEVNHYYSPTQQTHPVSAKSPSFQSKV